MSISGLDYSVRTSLGSNRKLLVHYDFTDGTGTPLVALEEEGDDTTINQDAVLNREPAINTGVFSGVIHDSSTDNAPASRKFSTGTFLVNNNADLRKSNLKIATPTLKYSSLSAIFDMQFDSSIEDGILFGSLEKTSTALPDGSSVEGAKGFNFGVNGRGQIFYHGFDKRGDFIYTASSLELSRRNMVGFSVDSQNAEITKLDYLNGTHQTESFPINTTFMANNEEFYLGGSETYYRSPSGEFKTFSGALNRFALFSGYISPPLMLRLGSGMLGEYFLQTGTEQPKGIVTGYDQLTIYKTGITGYEYQVTGTLEISTGREMLTGSLAAGTPHETGEGARYFKYYTLNNGDVKTAYKEELGFLHPDSGYQYLPTGDGAFATLGLHNVSGDITPYTIHEGIKTGGSVIINLYGSIAQTGVLSQVSGVKQTPVSQIVHNSVADISGVNLLGSAELFKKDFLFFMGERLDG